MQYGAKMGKRKIRSWENSSLNLHRVDVGISDDSQVNPKYMCVPVVTTMEYPKSKEAQVKLSENSFLFQPQDKDTEKDESNFTFKEADVWLKQLIRANKETKTSSNIDDPKAHAVPESSESSIYFKEYQDKEGKEIELSTSLWGSLFQKTDSSGAVLSNPDPVFERGFSLLKGTGETRKDLDSESTNELIGPSIEKETSNSIVQISPSHAGQKTEYSKFQISSELFHAIDENAESLSRISKLPGHSVFSSAPLENASAFHKQDVNKSPFGGEWTEERKGLSRRLKKRLKERKLKQPLS